MTLIYRACQFLAKSAEGRADEMIYRLRDVAGSRGLPREIRTGYDDETGLARLAAEAPEIPIVRDDRGGMRNQYWFGYEEEKKWTTTDTPEPPPAATALTREPARPRLRTP